MTNRTGVIGFIVFCLVFSFCLFPTECISVSKDPAPKTAVTTPAVKPPAPAKPATPAATPPGATELNAAIANIFIKNNRVFVVLNRTGSGKIAPEDFAKIMIRIEKSKGARQWSLAEVDKTRSLTGTGRAEFDTGIVLDKSETVKGILSFGKIEKSKHEMLAITGAAAAGPTLNASKPIGTMAGQIGRQQAAPPRPVPMLYDLGIRVRPPVSGSRYYQGEPISIQYEWTHSSAPSGNIVFSIENPDTFQSYATVTVPAARSGTVTLTPPAAMPLQRNSIVAFNRDSDAFGRSDVFEVASNSARIDFLSPARGDVYHPGGTMSVRYALNRRVEPGTITFLFGSEGRVARLTQAYNPPAPDVNPLPEYTLNVNIPASTPTGEYGIIAIHPKASGIGNTFSVRQRTWGSGHGLRMNIEGNPAVIFCNTPYTARLELTDPAVSGFYEPSFYYPGGSLAESFWLHLQSDGRSNMGRWTPASWQAGSLTVAADGRSMTGRFVASCADEGSGYVMTFNHTADVYADSSPFALGTGPASVTVLEPGKGGEHFVRNREHQVIWEYHPLVTATSLPSRWTIEFHKVDSATYSTSLEYTLRTSSPTCTEQRRSGSRIYRCQAAWNTSHLSAGMYKVMVAGGGADDWGTMTFSVGNTGSYDLSINRIFWDEYHNELIAEVNNPDGVMGAIDFNVSHDRDTWIIPKTFPSSASPVQIGLGAPGPLASSDRWNNCLREFTVAVDASNRVDERDETNNSLTSMIGPSRLIKFTALTFDASEETWYRPLSTSLPAIDWDHHGNGHTEVFMLDITNCGTTNVSGWVSISQEGCCIGPNPGSGGRFCRCPPDALDYRAIKVKTIELAPGHMDRIGLDQSDLVHLGSTIILSFGGDLATSAPANPVNIQLDY